MVKNTIISEHFDVREFVTPEIFNQFGENSIWFVSHWQTSFAEFLRNHFGKAIIINNWHIGGQFHERGTRNPWTETGGKLSQHKFKCAFDFNVAGMTSDEVWDHIMANKEIFMAQGLTTIEDKKMTQGWTHVDNRNTGLIDILIVQP